MATGSNFVLGYVNTASDPTILDIAPGTPAGVMVRFAGGLGVVGDPGFSSGVLGMGLHGVTGVSLNDVGVGVAGVGTKAGVVGECFGARSVGTRGTADYIGVIGTASTVITSVLVAAVHGETANRSGVGVSGQSDSFFGVRGMAGRVGLLTPGAIGVLGIGKNGGHGVIGKAGPPGFAGAFFGDASVAGDFAVTGAKAAAVPFPDGSLRLLYALESPECWFEDFGAARLVRGRAAVSLDRGFRAVIRGAYHVFLSPEGDRAGLYVARKSARGFEVRESGGGRAGIRFSYRIVARRKDVAAPRFARIRLPQLPKGADAPIGAPKGPDLPTLAQARARVAAGTGAKASRQASPA